WNTSSAAIKWPMCMGLNDPPNMPIFIKFTRQLYPAAVHGKPAKIKAVVAYRLLYHLIPVGGRDQIACIFMGRYTCGYEYYL
ncbi:MAG: hypothetical protein AAB069_08075, partial [Planctomycetota bacterium]